MLKLHHLVNKALAFLTDQIFSRYFDVVKKQLCRITDVHTELFEFSAYLNTGQIGGTTNRLKE